MKHREATKGIVHAKNKNSVLVDLLLLLFCTQLEELMGTEVFKLQCKSSIY